ncbi:MAG: ABC transporter permease subunit [Planctomycetota bacterium]
MIARLFAHEMRKLVARKRSWIGFAAFFALQIAILALLQLPKPKREIGRLLEQNALGFEDHYMGMTLAIVIIAFTFTLLGALYVALVGGDIVAKEVEEGTMRMILSRPIRRIELLGVKFAAVCVYTFALVVFLGVVALLFASAYRGGLGKLFIFLPDEGLFASYDTWEGLWRYARSMVCLAYGTLTVAAVAFMFSCFPMKPVSATVLTLSLFVADVILRNLPYFRSIQEWFISHHIGFWVRTYHEYPPWHEIAVSIGVIAAVSATAFAIGTAVFCTRDLKS